ncbi:alpha/beta hydrolase [Nonomuraea sp. NPDC005501]|uniref:alpha/beta hydrolase family protein n=1 Tax=Nonomuraea sp. NPDC005501 TaxID=3156884 RepID=UPI0033A3C063
MPTRPNAHDVTFASGEVALAGSLAVPGTAAGGAGVVMVGGSGPTDRDNDTYFPPIRRHLVEAGIAVLSYDKRGVGASSGDWRDATVDDLAADAVAALDFLRTRPGVRADAVGLFGHSEGGWVVLRAATARDDLPWVVTNSGPATTPAVQERHALLNRLRQAGAAPRDAGTALALYDALVDAGRRGAGFAAAARLVEAGGGPSTLGDHWAGMDERLWGFLSRKQDHDPLPDVHRLRCPHLALFGGADELVPVADSVRLLAGAACRPGRHPRATLTVEVFPGADHRVRTDGGVRPAPRHLDALTRWIGDRTRTGASASTRRGS